MRQQRVSVSQKTGEYGVAPLPALRQKRRGSDDELIGPPALEQHRKMIEDFRRINEHKKKITPPALANSNAAGSMTHVLPKSVETRDQDQILWQSTEDTRDQDIISPILKQLKMLEMKRLSNAEKSFTRVLLEHDDETRDASHHSNESHSDHRDETDHDRLEDLSSYSRDDDGKDFIGRPTTPPKIRSGSLLHDLVPVRSLNGKGTHAKDEVHRDAFELVLLVWTTDTLKVKVVDERNQQVVIHSSYFKHDEMQEVDQVSSKPRKDEPPPKVVPSDTWALTHNSNSIVEDVSTSDEESDEHEESDELALESFFCGFFCQEGDINECESSSTEGPDDIPSEISYHCRKQHHHHHHHHHSTKMNRIPSSELPTATSMVVSDVSSNSTEASDWSSESSESSESTEVLSIPESARKQETQEHQVVHQKRRSVKQGRWKKLFFSILHSRE